MLINYKFKRLAFLTIGVGTIFVAIIFGKNESYNIRRLAGNYVKVVEIDATTDPKLQGDSLAYHPPCKPTDVETQMGLSPYDVEKVYNATYKANVDMVVSLCNEDFNRIMMFATKLDVKQLYIYSKCGQSIELESDFVEQFDIIDVQELPNVGREGHSFLTHMLRDDLKPSHWSIFFQGQIEKNLQQAQLAIAAAQEHDQEKDGTNFINMYRINKSTFEFCDPIEHVRLTELDDFFNWARTPRYQNSHQTQQYSDDYSSLDIMSKLLIYRGEFVVRNDLFKSLNKDNVLNIQSRLEKSNDPYEGQLLERFWISFMGASDNCRCEGMPVNNLPVEDIALQNPLQTLITPDKSWWTFNLVKKEAFIRKLKMDLSCRSGIQNAIVVEVLDKRKNIVHHQQLYYNEPQTMVLRFNYIKGSSIKIMSSAGELRLDQVKLTGFLILSIEDFIS